jgi:arginine-tRNA-protein transferase
MLVLQQFVTEPHECPYLADRRATLRYSYAASLSGAEYEALMDSGHRKFGALFYRTECGDCRACRPIRVPVDRFRPNQSQRRALRINGDLELRVARPTVDAARLELYARYHRAQSARKGWPDAAKDATGYEFNFVHNPVPALELSVWETSTLRAVLIADVTPRVLSLVYHFHDPDLARRSLGTFAIVRAIDLAKSMRRPWVYLGYYVAGCGSMEYKTRFKPFELMDEHGVWAEWSGRS